MHKIHSKSPEAQSANAAADNLAKLTALFPDIFTEGPRGAAINVDVLKSLVGDMAVTETDEKYGLNWPGKGRARKLALAPSTGTLLPCPTKSIDWQTTKNLFVEGDNLEVLKLFQKSYSGKIKLIYIDPPYNTGRDFVYQDSFQENIKSYLELTGQISGGKKITSNTEAGGRFHTNWLNMIYPRLRLARSLMKDDGVLCVSIDDKEVMNLRLICNEIFGEENFVSTFVWQKRVSPDGDEKHVTSTHDYVVCYMKHKEAHKVKGFSRTAMQDDRYTNPDEDHRGLWTSSDLTRREYREHDFYEITLPSGRKVTPAAGRSWSVPAARFKELVNDNRIWFGPDGDSMPRKKRFLSEVAGRVVPVTWLTRELSGDNQGGKRHLKKLFPEVMDIFETPKPTELIRTLVSMFCEPDDTVLDFFAGTGTTGEAVLSLNVSENAARNFILVQMAEPMSRTGFKTIADLTKERLKRSAVELKKKCPSFSGDTGFRAFSLGFSNIKPWNPNPEDLKAALISHEDNIIEGRTELDILYELLLKLGLELCVSIAHRTICGKKVYAVGDGVLLTCLATSISGAEVEELANGIVAWYKELAPVGDTSCVFRDSAFADDVAKTRMATILVQNGMPHVRSL